MERALRSELTDVFAIQDGIARAIAETLRARLACSSARVAPPTRNMEAYHLWLKGRYHTLRQTPGEISRSRDFSQQVIAIDPGFAPAHLGPVFMISTGGLPRLRSGARDRAL